jgi:glutathione S-transferase
MVNSFIYRKIGILASICCITTMAQKLIQENTDITLGYWGIRGLAQPIRYLLIYANVPFSEIRLGVLQDATPLSEDKENEEWESVRSTLGMPFPNLPYLIDTSGGSRVRLSQSNAILRYLARRFDFYGDSESDRIEIDVLQDEAYDFRNEIIDTAYTLGENYTAVFEQFSTDTLPRYLDSFETYLWSRDNKNFFVGSRLSLVDFVLYELFWQMTLMVPNSITESKRPTLFSFIKAFEKESRIAIYQQNENHIERPINMPWASFT